MNISLTANPRLDPTHMPVEGGLQEFGEHYARYMLADTFAYDKTVLDVGTGFGYGAAYLARRARFVRCIDNVQEEAVTNAWASLIAISNTREQLQLETWDVENEVCPLAPNETRYDLVTMFEVWEHLANPRLALQKIIQVIADDGMMIVSTPDRDSNPPGVTRRSPHHMREYSGAEFEAELRLQFRTVTMLRQDFASATIIRPMRTRFGQFSNAPTLPHAFASGYDSQRWGVWIALCSNDLYVRPTTLALVYETRHIP